MILLKMFRVNSNSYEINLNLCVTNGGSDVSFDDEKHLNFMLNYKNGHCSATLACEKVRFLRSFRAKPEQIRPAHTRFFSCNPKLKLVLEC